MKAESLGAATVLIIIIGSKASSAQKLSNESRLSEADRYSIKMPDHEFLRSFQFALVANALYKKKQERARYGPRS